MKKSTEKRFMEWLLKNDIHRIVSETNDHIYVCEKLTNNRTLHINFEKGHYLARLRGAVRISVRYRDYNFRHRKDDWVYMTYFDSNEYEKLLNFDINKIINFKEITKEELIELQE